MVVGPVEIFGSVAIPCFGVVLVYFYSCCVKRRVGQLEERIGLLETRPVGAIAPVLPQASQVPVQVYRLPYTPPTYQYAPYPPYQQVPPRPSAPIGPPATV
jgi:hypothetical protein